MDEKKQEEDEKNGNDGNTDSMADRLTGFQIFSEKSGVFNLDKLEAAAEELENGDGGDDDDDVGDVDEDLFDDDEDLDDLDFDSDEDDDDDDDDSEPDI